MHTFLNKVDFKVVQSVKGTFYNGYRYQRDMIHVKLHYLLSLHILE